MIQIRLCGCFRIGKKSGNFGLKSNGKVCFGSVRLECSGLPPEVVHFDWSDRNLPSHFGKPVNCPTFFFGRFHLFREFGKEIKKKKC